MRRNAWPSLSSRLCYAVMAVDHVVTIGCDFSQEDRARQVGCIDGSFIEAAASAIVRYIDELNKLSRKPLCVGVYKGQQSRDVELKDAVRIQLITGLGGAWLKAPIQSENGRLAKWFER
jgi:hypothetical protein